MKGTIEFEGNVGTIRNNGLKEVGDRKVLNFTVASTDAWRTNHEPDPETGEIEPWNTVTTWFSVAAWNGLAIARAPEIKVGTKVLIKGVIKPGDGGNPRIYENKQGKPASSYEVTAFQITILGQPPFGTGQ